MSVWEKEHKKFWPKKKTEEKKEELPPRGTGLKIGRADERRAGNRRTDKERRERHPSEE